MPLDNSLPDEGQPADMADKGDDAVSASAEEPSLETLREILFSRYRQQIADLEAELAEIERRISDKDALVAMLSPVLGDAIRQKIRDAREEMVEALYPVIGQTIARAVNEAVRNLARTIDAQMRTSFDLGRMLRRLKARLGGVSNAEMALREGLPFEVEEIFLIHRETGLLLRHISCKLEESPDTDLISGMLTAIRDFAQEAFGRGEEGQLDEIQYGNRRIVIEAARYTYLAVVVDGIEPPDFRADIRQLAVEINLTHEDILQNYNGDSTAFAAVDEALRPLIAPASSSAAQLSTAQKRALAGILGIMLLCLAVVCLGSGLVWQTIHSTPVPIVVTPPTATFTSTPTNTPKPTSTATATSTPTATPTFSPTPTHTASPTPTLTATPAATSTPAPVLGQMIGNTWLRQAPSASSPRLGVVLKKGQPVEILTAFEEWYQVRWKPQDQAEVIGWVPAKWVGVSVPERIVTPSSSKNQ